MKKENYLKEIGMFCKRWRRSQGINIKDVANDLGYSIGNISNFENGKNDNVQILLWYVKHTEFPYTEFNQKFLEGWNNEDVL